MAEFVLGLGTQKSLRSVVTSSEKEVARTQGIPRKLTTHADNLEVVAEREEFQGDFETYQIRLRGGPEVLDPLKDTLNTYSDVCKASQDGEWQVIECARNGTNNLPRVQEAVDKLSGNLKLPEVWRVSGDRFRVERISVELLFQAMVQYKASDVHLAPGQPPVFRVDSQTRQSELMGSLSAPQLMSLIEEVAPARDWKEFQDTKQASFNFHQVGLGYSRVSVFIKSGAPHVTFRFLPETVPSFEDLNVPRAQMEELAKLHHGLILVTGMTGSGKTTTTAALIDYINSNKSVHILSIENPVEYVHHNKKALVSQRGLGLDVATFNLAVTGALRHDPDVIVIGEMRDPDTIRAAINAAATGHLVISTLHANTASEVVNRVVSFFDPVERDLVKLQLRDCVRCIICQRLVPRLGGGRIPALEIMFNDIKPINDAIVAGDTDGIRVGMQQKISHSILFEEYLFRMHKDGKIDLENARHFATERSILDQMLMGTYTTPRLDSIKAAGGH
ncbi:MAG: PilT/PilU family type 4a pilus ATPase [FCB group bacterium]|jgi:twitching motility protein PilT|nr:PilT/PilU family type 4a pilus ATPase [FCB group bacterium]